MKKIVMLVALVAAALTSKADYWMTFCKTQVWYMKMPGESSAGLQGGLRL